MKGKSKSDFEYDNFDSSFKDEFEDEFDDVLEENIEAELKKDIKNKKHEATSELLADSGYEQMQRQMREMKDDYDRERLELKKMAEKNKEIIEEYAKEIKNIKNQLFSPQKVDSMIDKRINDMKNSFVRKNEVNNILNKDKDFSYVTQHFKELDKHMIARKHYDNFIKKIDILRRETALLNRLSREVSSHKQIQKDLLRLKRAVFQLEKKLERLRLI